MLTVRYEQLGLRRATSLLDLGCGFGRHAYEAAERGARVVAFDYADAELKEVRNTFGAMADGGRGRAGRRSPARCRATAPACRSPTAPSTAVIASEVLEHIPDDQAALDELARVLRARRHAWR